MSSKPKRVNEWDLAGHAQKAKELLDQVNNGLHLAAEASNRSQVESLLEGLRLVLVFGFGPVAANWSRFRRADDSFRLHFPPFHR